MGLLFVLLLYLLVLSALATVVAACMACGVYLALRKAPAKRKRAVALALAFPFLCVGFAGALYLCYGATNMIALHRDPGLGDGWETPLPNGYALSMIDTTDQGTVYRSRKQNEHTAQGETDTVSGVRQLQVAGTHIYGARDSGYIDRIGQESRQVDTWFALETGKDRIVEFHSFEELRRQAATEGITLRLQDFQQVFYVYRTTWFDYLFVVVLVVAPSLGLFAFIRWVWKLRLQSAS